MAHQLIKNMKTFLLILISTTIVSSQNKRDYRWFFGSDQGIEEGIQALQFNFNERPFEPQQSNNGLEFDQNNASICDEEGNLLFYTNGCAVANRNHEIMPNGDSLNYGIFFQTFWRDDCGNGYPGSQDIMILPDPKYELGYYIIHKTEEYDPSLDPRFFFKYLKYTYVDMSLENGFGDVTFKNEPFHESRYLWSYLTAISHSNGKDWWIIQPKSEVEENYIFLLNEHGFTLIDSFPLGNVPFDENTSAGGDAKFSPDGSKYVFFNYGDGLYVYDFDRSSGQLSSFQSLLFDINAQLFSSVEFSPNSRYLYLTNMDSLFQVDLYEESLKDGLMLINVHDGLQDPFSTRYFTSILAPDCKIYIRPGSGSYSMHVINKPNEKGLACDFVERGLKLPRISARGGFPNFPRFRVDEDEVCDPTITTFLGEDIFIRKELNAFPNPTRDIIRVSIPNNLTGYIYVYDMMGREVIAPQFTEGLAQITLLISHLSSGYYTMEFVPNKLKENILFNKVIYKN